MYHTNPNRKLKAHTFYRSPKIARTRISPNHEIALPKSATSQSQLKARRQTDGRTTDWWWSWILGPTGSRWWPDRRWPPPSIPVCLSFQVPSYSLWWVVWAVVRVLLLHSLRWAFECYVLSRRETRATTNDMGFPTIHWVNLFGRWIRHFNERAYVEIFI